jgi:hypothetical protein
MWVGRGVRDDGRAPYIWVVSDLLNEILVEVARVAKEFSSDVIGVLQASKDSAFHGNLGAFSKLRPGLLSRGVEFTDPVMMADSSIDGNMLLEDDYV